MSARSALLETLASYLGDRKLLALIGTTVTGVALNAHSIRSNASFLSLYTAAAASATPQKPSRQPSAIDDRFRRRLLNLIAILLPSWRSRESSFSSSKPSPSSAACASRCASRARAATGSRR